MNLPELKEDFYKRYSASDNFLHFVSNGLLCALLGHCGIEYAPSLTCALSMRVQMFARAMGGNIIKLQSTDTNKCLVYNFGDRAELFRGFDFDAVSLMHCLARRGAKGAQILYDCSIPEFLPRKEAFAVTLVQSLMRVSGIETDALETAALAARGSLTDPYLATVSSRTGYCTLISSGEPKNFPLPLSGYKILSAHCTEKDKDRSKQIKYAFDQIRRVYPHIGTISEVTPEMFSGVKSSFKDKTALRYMYHLVNENARIKTACAALKRCDIKTLFTEMNTSQKSMERFWDLGREHLFLARESRSLDGVKAVRSWKNGIIAIVENDKIDYVLGMMRNDFENTIGYQPTFCISEPA
ncbi:MAG: hypothetical protein LIO53_02460 [Oscillospiraceae bacterium]|nr:hypothetical protein [Oscillospiraceae bacterium]